VPARYAGRELSARIGGTQIAIADADRVIAVHDRSVARGSQNLVLDHYLEILATKPGALPSSLALAQARKSGALTDAHERFWRRARRRCGDAGGTRAFIDILLLHRSLPFPAVHAALDLANRCGSVDPALVAIEARRIAEHRSSPAGQIEKRGLRGFERPTPVLTIYDGLLSGGSR
jgi:hypothetical protein